MLSPIVMIDRRPYALIVERDEANRARLTAALRESGFVVAAFRDCRGALAALAVRPVDLAVVAGHEPGGADAIAAARQIRHCRPGSKLLFIGGADALPATPGAGSGLAVTRPFDKRRLLSAVVELLARDGVDREHRDAAEMALLAARLACLRSQQTGFASLLPAKAAADAVVASRSPETV